jgi:hypothetical protein
MCNICTHSYEKVRKLSAQSWLELSRLRHVLNQMKIEKQIVGRALRQIVLTRKIAEHEKLIEDAEKLTKDWHEILVFLRNGPNNHLVE